MVDILVLTALCTKVLVNTLLLSLVSNVVLVVSLAATIIHGRVCWLGCDVPLESRDQHLGLRRLDNQRRREGVGNEELQVLDRLGEGVLVDRRRGQLQRWVVAI